MSNLVCNHTSDWQNWMTGMQESDLIITCRIGRQEVLLPINHIYDKILERNLTLVIRFHKKKHQQLTYWDVRHQHVTWYVKSTYTGMMCLLSLQLSYYTVQLPVQAWCEHCPISSQIRLVVTNQVREFCYSLGLSYNHACGTLEGYFLEIG